MVIKLKDFKHKSDKIIAEVVIKDKQIIRTKSLDDSYIVNGKKANSDFKSTYEFIVLDEYDDNYKYGKYLIEYAIFSGTTFTAIIDANFFQLVYLKLLFNKYLIQRIEGGVRTTFEVIAFLITTILTWYVSKC